MGEPTGLGEAQQRPQELRNHPAEPCQHTGPWKRIHWYCFRLINMEAFASQHLSYRCDTWALFFQACPYWAFISASGTVQISLPRCWFPWEFLLKGPYSSKLWFLITACLDLSFALPCDLNSLTDVSRVVDSSLFRFSLFLRIESQLPSSFHASLEIGNPKLVFFNYFILFIIAF